MSVPSGLGGSFVSQVLYTYMQFPVLEWRKDTIFTNYDFFLEDFNVYEPSSPTEDGGCGKEDPNDGGDGGGGGGGGKGFSCPPCGQPIRQGQGTTTLSWDAVPDAKRYIVQWSRSPSCRGRSTKATSVAAPAVSLALAIGQDVVPGEAIFYRVTAIGNNGQSSSSECKMIGICPQPVEGFMGEIDREIKCCEQAGITLEIEGPDKISCCCEPETFTVKIEQKDAGGGDNQGSKVERVEGAEPQWVIVQANEDVVAGNAEAGGDQKPKGPCGKIKGGESGTSVSVIGIGAAGGGAQPAVPGEDSYRPTPPQQETKFKLLCTVKFVETVTNEQFECTEGKEITCDCKSSTIDKKPWIGQHKQLQQLRQLHPSCLTIWKSLCAQLMSGDVEIPGYTPGPGQPATNPGPEVRSFGNGNPLNRFGSAPSIYTGYRYDPWAGTNFYGYSGYGYAGNYWGNYTVYKFGGAGMIPFQHSPDTLAVDGSSRPASPAASGEGPSNIRTLGMAGEFLAPEVIQKLHGPRSAIVMKPSESQWESTYGVTWGPPVRALKTFLTNDLYLDEVNTSGGWKTGVNQILDGSYFSYTLNLGDVGMNAGALTIKMAGRYWVTANIEATGEHTLGNFQSGFSGQGHKLGFEAHITKNGIAQLESQVLTKAFAGTTRETQRITSSKKILMHLEKGDVLGLVVRKRTGNLTISGSGGSFNDQWMSPTIKGTNTFITLEPISSVNY